MSTQYAVKVCGVGWVTDRAPTVENSDANALVFDRSDAEIVAQMVMRVYRRLGLRHIAENVVIASRSVTVSVGEWSDSATPAFRR